MERTIEGNTRKATNRDAPILQNGQQAKEGIWYTFTGTGEQLKLSTCATCAPANIIKLSPGQCFAVPFDPCTDTRLSLYSGDCSGGLDFIASNDDFCGEQSEITFCSEPEVTYYVYLDRPVIIGETHPQDYELTLECLTPDCPPPGNDLCSQATPLEFFGTVEGSTTFSTDQDAPLLCNGTAANAGVWYSFRGIGDEILLSTCTDCSSNPCSDTRISVFEGDCNSTLTCIGNNDDFCGEQSELKFCTESFPTMYYVYVDNPRCCGWSVFAIYGATIQFSQYQLSEWCCGGGKDPKRQRGYCAL